MTLKRLSLAFVTLLCAAGLGAQDFHINSSGYFNKDGVDVMAFDDFYPEGHQGGISVLMNGHRVASNGDIRFDATPASGSLSRSSWGAGSTATRSSPPSASRIPAVTSPASIR